MVECGDADCMISGLTKNIPTPLRPALQIIGTEEGVNKVAGMYLLMTKMEAHCFWQTQTVNYNPTAERACRNSDNNHKGVKALNIKPRIAMLS